MAKSLKEFKDEHNPDADVVYLRQRIAELEAQREQERAATGEAHEIIAALAGAIEKAKPQKMVYQPSKRSGSAVTHVLHLTDLHYGEVTEKDEVDGFGEFNPTIAEKRLQALGQAIIASTEAARAGHNVPNLHILGTADYISGDIHQELQVTNAFPAPVQAVRCGYALGALVAMFAPHFASVTADLVSLDNHGRLGRKPQASQGGQNNWSYVVAQVVKQHVSSLPNVTVNVHAKPSALVPIGPERYLCFHGHQIRGWAGLPHYGFERRVAMEAVKRMGVQESAFTKLVLGHFHHAINADTWLLGGSLSGTNAFDHSCGRHSKPHQTSWYVHPKHGEFAFSRWWL